MFKSGIFDEECDGHINHALVISGYSYDSSGKYWILKNSWGEKWGEKGYIKLLKGKNKCAIGKYMTCYPNMITKNTQGKLEHPYYISIFLFFKIHPSYEGK